MVPIENTGPSMIDVDAAYHQLRNLALTWAGSLDTFLGSVDEAMEDAVDAATEEIMAALIRRNPAQRTVRGPGFIVSKAATDPQRAARRARALVPEPTPDFWRSDLGRLVSQIDGYTLPIVPRVQAAAILGVTRQRVAQMVNQGRLVDAGMGVTNASLLEAIRQRRERE